MYASVSDVRLLTGVPSTVISAADMTSLIALSDAQIDDDIGAFTSPIPTRIKHLSSLLTAIKVYSRPSLRGGFSAGDFSKSQEQVEENLQRWEMEARRTYAYYGKVPREVKPYFGRTT